MGELHVALRHVGLDDDHMRRIITRINDVMSHGRKITFPMWYDIVADVHITDGLASSHCCIYRALLWPFLGIERWLRKKVILRRASASQYVMEGGDGQWARGGGQEAIGSNPGKR